ncbi:type VI secretion system accessory protein TagJ [Sphingomonas sp. NCPPB 2930]
MSTTSTSPTIHLSGTTLAERLADAEGQVRAGAADPQRRVYLFQLLCVLAQWDRAVAQLQVCSQLDASATAMAQTYREVIRCEKRREAVFAGRAEPAFIGDAPDWATALGQALAHAAGGDTDAAAALRQEALNDAPEVAGEADGQPFAWIADGDSRLGPVCEVFANGRYVWVPFDQIGRIALDAPQDLRDLVWASGSLLLRDGTTHAALFPARYPGSGASGDDAAAASRLTRWEEVTPGCWAGVGQKMWVTDERELSVLDCRSLVMGEDAAT